MDEHTMTPLQRAIVRNHQRRRMRHWALFRDLASGRPADATEQETLVQLIAEAGEVLLEGTNQRFEGPEGLDNLAAVLDDRFDGLVIVGLFTGCFVEDGELVSSFVAEKERVIAALPLTLGEQDHAFLVDPQRQIAACIGVYSYRYQSEKEWTWLSLAERLADSEWRDVFQAD